MAVLTMGTLPRMRSKMFDSWKKGMHGAIVGKKSGQSTSTILDSIALNFS